MTREDYDDMIWDGILDQVTNERLREVIAAICDELKYHKSKNDAIKSKELAYEVGKTTGEFPTSSAMAKAIRMIKNNKYVGLVSYPGGYYIENTYAGDMKAALFEARNARSRINHFKQRINMLKTKYPDHMLPDDPEDFC